MATYSGNRPSVRSIRAGATAPEMNERVSVSGSAEARRRAMAKNPDIFKTDAQLRAEARRDGVARGFSGTKLTRYIDTEVNNKMRNNKYAQEEAIRKEQPRIDSEIAAEDAKRINDAKKAENAANQGRTVTSGKMTFTPEQVEYFDKLEREAQAYMKANPGAAQTYQGVQDFLQQLGNMNEEDRAKTIKELEAQANAEVDTYFDEKKKYLTDRLNLKLKSMNDKFNVLSENEKFKLEQSIQQLDVDSAEALEAGFESTFQRMAEGNDSGMFRRLADTIMEKRSFGEADAQRVFALNVNAAAVAKQNDAASDELETGRDLLENENDRITERKIALEERKQNLLKQGFTLDEMTGQIYDKNAYGPNAVPDTSQPSPVESARGLNPLPRVGNTRLTSAAAPRGSSLEMARASGSMSIQEQRAARERLMNPTTAIRATPAPARTTVVNPNTNRSYSGGAASRLAARLSR